MNLTAIRTWILASVLLFAVGCGGGSSSGTEPVEVFPTSQEDLDRIAGEDGYLDALMACKSLQMLSIAMSKQEYPADLMQQLDLIKQNAVMAAEANDRYQLLELFASGFVDAATNPGGGKEELAAVDFDNALSFCGQFGF